MTAEELARLLDELAGRLEGPARYLFDLTVRQVVIEAVTGLITAAVLLVTATIVGVITRRTWVHKVQKWEADDYSRRPDIVDHLFMPVVGIGVALFVAWLFAMSAVTSLLNPEFAALSRLLSVLKP
jgi:hypothetical protein